jgi:hypothetical protein
MVPTIPFMYPSRWVGGGEREREREGERERGREREREREGRSEYLKICSSSTQVEEVGSCALLSQQ